MFKRLVPFLLLAPVVLLAFVGLAEPSRASTPGEAQMAPAADMAPGPSKPGGAKPGMWKDYKPSDGQGSAGQNKRRFTSGELVVAAYGIIWAVVFIYVLLLALRQRSLQAELAELRRQLDVVDPPAVAGESKET